MFKIEVHTKLIGQERVVKPLAWGFQKDSELIGIFNYHLHKMHEAGVIDRLRQEIEKQHEMNAANTQGGNSIRLFRLQMCSDLPVQIDRFRLKIGPAYTSNILIYWCIVFSEIINLKRSPNIGLKFDLLNCHIDSKCWIIRL